LALGLVRIHAIHLFLIFDAAFLLTFVAWLALDQKLGLVALEVVIFCALVTALLSVILLYVMGLQPTFHWLRRATAMTFSSRGIRVTMTNGSFVEKTWDWISAARTQPFGLSIFIANSPWIFYVDREQCPKEAYGRLLDLMTGQGKVNRADVG